MFIELLEFVGLELHELNKPNKPNKHNKHYYRETKICNL
jgi:hypothetical protein